MEKKVVIFLLLISLSVWVEGRVTNRIRNISFSFDHGAGCISERSLLKISGISTSEFFDAYKIQNAIKNLYETGQFEQIKAYKKISKNGIDINFYLYCYGTIDDIRIHGAKYFKKSAILDVMNVYPHMPFRDKVVLDAVEKIKSIYRDNGFFDVYISYKTSWKHNGMVLDIFIKEGRRYRIRMEQMSISKPGPILPPVKISGIFHYIHNRFYSKKILKDIKDKIEQLYVEAGFVSAKFEWFLSFQTDIPYAVAPLLSIKPGPRLFVKIHGAQIDEKAIKKNMAFYRLKDTSEFAQTLSKEDIINYFDRKHIEIIDISSNRRIDEYGYIHVDFFVRIAKKIKKYEIKLSGNIHFRKRDILEAIGMTDFENDLAGKSCNDICKKVQAFYKNNGYLKAKIVCDKKVVKQVMLYHVKIKEGKQFIFSGIKIESNNPYNEKIHNEISNILGRPFSERLLQEVQNRIRSFFSSKGYQIYSMNISTIFSGNSVNLKVKPLLEGPTKLKNLVITGKLHTKEKILKKLINIKDDSLFDTELLKRVENNLYNTGLFENVKIKSFDVFGKKGEKNVVVNLREAPRYIFGYGMGYNEYEGLRGLLDLTDSNFLGLAQNLGLLLRFSRRHILLQTSLYDNGYFLGSVPLGFSFLAEREERISFISRRLRFSLYTTHTLSPGEQLVFRLSYDKIKNYNIEEGIKIGEIPRSEAPINMAAFSVSYISDRRDDVLEPTKGSLTSAYFSIAPKVFGSEVGFAKILIQRQDYHILHDSFVLATSLRLGTINTIWGSGYIPISERFFAGGGATLRGYKVDRAGPLDPQTHSPLGGKAIFIGNVEIRFPLFKSIGGAFFYDTGNVFKNISKMSVGGFSHTVGVGLRFKTPLGPLRFDFGYSLKDIPFDKDNQYFITVGNAF